MTNLVAILAVLSVAALPAHSAPLPGMKVYKTATCGCCGKWVEHMKANGFTVDVSTVPETGTYRQKHGVPVRFASCHTALVGGYTVEGHVPAADVIRVLKEKPKATGLVLPGMPLGSPGMNGPKSAPLTIYAVTKDGAKPTVYATE